MDYIKVTKVADVRLEKGKTVVTGTLHLLAHHILFCPAGSDQEIWISYSTIQTVERKFPTPQGLHPIHVICRNFVFLKVFIKREQDAGDVYGSLQKLLNISSIEQVYAFFYKPVQPITSGKGWKIYDPLAEFSRLGVGRKTDTWRFTTINENYEFCPTYPRVLVVPTKISDNVLKYTAKFRSKARVPALSYLHRTNMISITRSSQPLVGLKQNRSIQDEKLVEAIFATGRAAQQPGSQNLIIDARPTANAIAQTALGAGTESVDNYRGCKLAFLGIDNIHVVRDSLTKMVETLTSVQGGPIPRSLLDKSGWLKHIKNLIEGTLTIVQHVHIQDSHVLVHCSDGWDRTAQLCSLAELCLDPYYRTIEGFAVLVEKEWVAFGHKFQDRCGHLSHENNTSMEKQSVSAQIQAARRNVSNSITSAAKSFLGKNLGASIGGGVSPGSSSANLYSSGRSISYPGGGLASSSSGSTASSETSSQNNVAPREVSPVFTQFLDCVYQLWTQFPTHFEFSDRLLTLLNTHLYSCQFGTFLFNCERERANFSYRPPGEAPVGIEKTTYSVWDFVFSSRDEIANPHYIPLEDRRMANIPGSAAETGSASVVGRGVGVVDHTGGPGSVSDDGEILFPSSANLKYWAAVLVREEGPEECGEEQTVGGNVSRGGTPTPSLQSILGMGGSGGPSGPVFPAGEDGQELAPVTAPTLEGSRGPPVGLGHNPWTDERAGGEPGDESEPPVESPDTHQISIVTPTECVKAAGTTFPQRARGVTVPETSAVVAPPTERFDDLSLSTSSTDRNEDTQHSESDTQPKPHPLWDPSLE